MSIKAISANAGAKRRGPTPAEIRQAKMAKEKFSQQKFKSTAKGNANSDMMDKIRKIVGGGASGVNAQA